MSGKPIRIEAVREGQQVRIFLVEDDGIEIEGVVTAVGRTTITIDGQMLSKYEIETIELIE
jgi:hypothetical protein